MRPRVALPPVLLHLDLLLHLVLLPLLLLLLRPTLRRSPLCLRLWLALQRSLLLVLAALLLLLRLLGVGRRRRGHRCRAHFRVLDRVLHHLLDAAQAVHLPPSRSDPLLAHHTRPAGWLRRIPSACPRPRPA